MNSEWEPGVYPWVRLSFRLQGEILSEKGVCPQGISPRSS